MSLVLGKTADKKFDNFSEGCFKMGWLISGHFQSKTILLPIFLVYFRPIFVVFLVFGKTLQNICNVAFQKTAGGGGEGCL